MVREGILTKLLNKETTDLVFVWAKQRKVVIKITSRLSGEVDFVGQPVCRLIFGMSCSVCLSKVKFPRWHTLLTNSLLQGSKHEPACMLGDSRWLPSLQGSPQSTIGSDLIHQYFDITKMLNINIILFQVKPVPNYFQSRSLMGSSRNQLKQTAQKSNKKSVDEAFERSTKRGPVTWASLALCALAGGGLLLYVRHLKEEKQRGTKTSSLVLRCYHTKINERLHVVHNHVAWFVVCLFKRSDAHFSSNKINCNLFC